MKIRHMTITVDPCCGNDFIMRADIITDKGRAITHKTDLLIEQRCDTVSVFDHIWENARRSIVDTMRKSESDMPPAVLPGYKTEWLVKHGAEICPGCNCVKKWNTECEECKK